MNPLDADLWFRIGFRDVHLSWERYADLCRHALGIHLEYLLWLSKHSVNIMTHPIESLDGHSGVVLSAHYTLLTLGSRIARESPFPQTRFEDHPPLSNSISELTEMAKSNGLLDATDNCLCRCSLAGCTPFTYLLKGIVYPNSHRLPSTDNVEKPTANLFSIYFQEAGAILEAKHHVAALRFLTFSAFKLRHTCCDPFAYHPAGRSPLCSLEDVEEVEEEQAHELALLEELLAEFEDKVAAILHDQDQDRGISNLVDFWKGTWVTRVAEVRAELEGGALSDDERLRAEEIGVVWDKPASPEETRNPYDETTFEHWFFELDQIEVE
jgi:hypothetical protein